MEDKLRTANLPPIRALAASQHCRIRRPSAGHGPRIDTMRLVPSKRVVWIVNRQPANVRGAQSRRRGELHQAGARILAGVCRLAACKLGGVGRRVAVDGEAAVAVGPAGGVVGMPRFGTIVVVTVAALKVATGRGRRIGVGSFASRSICGSI